MEIRQFGSKRAVSETQTNEKNSPARILAGDDKSATPLVPESSSDIFISSEALVMQRMHGIMSQLKPQLTPWYMPDANDDNQMLIHSAAANAADQTGQPVDEWLLRIQHWNLDEDNETENPVGQRTLKLAQHLARVLSNEERATFRQLHQHAEQNSLPTEHVESVAWSFAMDKLYAQNQPGTEMPKLGKDYLQELLNRIESAPENVAPSKKLSVEDFV